MPNPNFIATIIAEGQRFSNWETIAVKRDIGIPFTTFEFTASEFPAGQTGWNSIRLKPGDPVQIMLGGAQVLNGFITTRSARYGARGHELAIAGKSRTELTRSSVEVKPGNYNGYTFEQATKAVLAPFGVGLSIINPPAIISKPFKSLAVQYGETVLEFIARIAMMRGLFLTDDSQGNLVALNSGPNDSPDAELTEGVNILEATCTLDDQEEFGVLSVVGQHQGSDDDWPTRDNSVTLVNPNGLAVKRQLIIAENAADNEELTARANLEAARSSWPTVRCSITVAGWQNSRGALWGPPQGPPELITVNSPMLFPNDTGSTQLYVKSCTYTQDSENGTRTILGLINRGDKVYR